MESHTGHKRDDKKSRVLVVAHSRLGTVRNWRLTCEDKTIAHGVAPKSETRMITVATEGKQGEEREMESDAHHAWTKICFALSDALVVVAARTFAASFSKA